MSKTLSKIALGAGLAMLVAFSAPTPTIGAPLFPARTTDAQRTSPVAFSQDMVAIFEIQDVDTLRKTQSATQGTVSAKSRPQRTASSTMQGGPTLRPARQTVAAPPAPVPPHGVANMHPMRVMATAYALTGRTAGGTRTAPGTIAVDPRLIPLGTHLYVPGYGWGTALDTGGAIKGNVIDLWMPSTRQCFQWGVRSVQILVESRTSYGAPHRQLASRAGKRRVHRRD